MAAKTSSVDPVALITSDHRRVERLFDEIDAAQGDQRGPLVDQLVTELAVHMRIEEDHIYPIVASDIEAEMAEEAETEHGLAREGLEKLCSLAPDQPGFGAALDMVRAGIEHHVGEEETELLPQLKRKMTAAQLAELGATLETVKEQLMETGPALRKAPRRTRRSSGHNGASTKAELVQRAKKQHVRGYSKMTKDELEAALSRA
jgi:iron-sulfur cluster repair protein YtfE (RIC family)